MRMHDEQVDSDEQLVARLLADQFPEWADLPIRRLPSDGTDNAMYRLGDEFVARLPLIDWAVPQIAKEHTWLPRIAPKLPLAVPEMLAVGEPGHDFPWPWAVYRWIEGANAYPVDHPLRAAEELAAFILALRTLEWRDAPESQRARPLAADDDKIRAAIEAVRGEFDVDALFEMWEAAIAAPAWHGAPVLVHADLSDGNVMQRDGRITAVIDWSCFGRGEPANDLDPAWGLFAGAARDAFRDALAPDDATWTRGRGWAVRCVYGLVYYRKTNPGIVARCRRRLRALIEEYEGAD